MPLRVPGSLLLGPLPLAWIATVAAPIGVPLLLPARQWVAGGLPRGRSACPPPPSSARALHGLAGAGWCSCPPGSCSTTCTPWSTRCCSPAARSAGSGPRPTDPGDAVDLTQRALGLALELELTEETGDRAPPPRPHRCRSSRRNASCSRPPAPARCSAKPPAAASPSAERGQGRTEAAAGHAAAVVRSGCDCHARTDRRAGAAPQVQIRTTPWERAAPVSCAIARSCALAPWRSTRARTPPSRQTRASRPPPLRRIRRPHPPPHRCPALGPPAPDLFARAASRTWLRTEEVGSGDLAGACHFVAFVEDDALAGGDAAGRLLPDDVATGDAAGARVAVGAHLGEQRAVDGLRRPRAAPSSVDPVGAAGRPSCPTVTVAAGTSTATA